MTELESVTPMALPGDFQDRVFKAIAVQRPAALAYIKEVRRKHPGATPADVMKLIEQRYVATTTSASAAVGATATIPAVGIPAAIGLGVADLLFFYESTAMFAICMAELRGYRIDDPDRAKVVVLGAMLGEKRKSRVTELVMTALPAGASYTAARMATESTVSHVSPKWGDLLSQQLPDSALVPVAMVLAREALAHGAILGTARIGSKALPFVGAFIGGASSYYFGTGVVKSCREGFSAPLATWPEWLEVGDGDTVLGQISATALGAVRTASDSAVEAAKKAGTATKKAASDIAGRVRRDKPTD